MASIYSETRSPTMAAHKRPARDMDNDDRRPLSTQRPHHRRRENKIDSDGSAASAVDNDEFVLVKLSDISKEVQCPICLGIIRRTRTVMECLHRFCRECIDKSMRLGNNECPACRTHCASRRSLRDDPNYDTLIAILYPDIEKYEEEELAFHDEEKNRNKEIQSSIAQTLRRQTEALGRRRIIDKAGGSVFVRRSQGSQRNSQGQNSYLTLRNRTTRESTAFSDDDVDDLNDNDVEHDSSSADEASQEINPRRHKRWSSHRFSSTTLADGGREESDDTGRVRDNTSALPVRAGTTEVLAWGRGGTRSHTRFGSSSGSGGKNSKNTRLTKLLDHLRNLDNNESELDMHLTLLPLDKQSVPSLERPYLCCHPSLPMRLLRQFISLQIPVQADELEILVNIPKYPHGNETDPSCATFVDNVELSKCEASQGAGEMRVLNEEETVANLVANASSSQGNLVCIFYKIKVLVYRSNLAT